MKKHEKILDKIESEKRSLDKYVDINFGEPNEFIRGKYHLIEELKKFISDL